MSLCACVFETCLSAEASLLSQAYTTSASVHAMAIFCSFCAKSFSSKNSLGNHTRKFGGSCGQLMTDQEFESLRPSEVSPKKVHCLICNKDIAKRGIVDHFERSHQELFPVVKTWHVYSDFKAVKQQKDMNAFSHFQTKWNAKCSVREAAEARDNAAMPVQDRVQDPVPLQWQASEAPDQEETHTPDACESEEIQVPDHVDSEWVDSSDLDIPGPGTPLGDPVPDGFMFEGHVQEDRLQDVRAPATPPANAISRQDDVHLARSLEALEARICDRVCGHVNSVVESMNVVLRQGLGEVVAKYAVFLRDFVEEYDPRVHGTKFPQNLLSDNFDLSGFKLTIFEFRGLSAEHASNTYRDIVRFLGCFDFADEAGRDLPNLLVSIFKAGLLKNILLSKVWQGKKNYIVSLRTSLQHFVGYLENEERVHRAVGGLTSALGNILKAGGCVILVCVVWLLVFVM